MKKHLWHTYPVDWPQEQLEQLACLTVGDVCFVFLVKICSFHCTFNTGTVAVLEQGTAKHLYSDNRLNGYCKL